MNESVKQQLSENKIIYSVFYRLTILQVTFIPKYHKYAKDQLTFTTSCGPLSVELLATATPKTNFQVRSQS
jgi:hypothetical protein